MDRIRSGQETDAQLRGIMEDVRAGRPSDFQVDSEGILRFRSRLCVPDDTNLRREIMTAAHQSVYTVHPGSTKMYRDLRQHYWWSRMKVDVADFVARCLTCQQVKAEHQHPGGYLQPLTIPEWKWERITMDFVVGLRRTAEGHDSI